MQIPNKKIGIALVVLVLISVLFLIYKIAAIGWERYQAGKENGSATSGQSSKEERERQKDTELAKKGYVRMIAGKVMRVDQEEKSFIIDADSGSSEELYKIWTGSKTEYLAVAFKQIDAPAGEEEGTPIPEPEFTRSSFIALQEGKIVEIDLGERMDILGSEKLTAERINIFSE